MELLILLFQVYYLLTVIQFKFQYGATNINLKLLAISFTEKFKFQYGATNM